MSDLSGGKIPISHLICPIEYTPILFPKQPDKNNFIMNKERFKH